jgi:hypothetical protein
MLSFKLHMRIGEPDLLLPVAGHIVFTTVAGQGWLAGLKALSGCNAALSSRDLFAAMPLRANSLLFRASG